MGMMKKLRLKRAQCDVPVVMPISQISTSRADDAQLYEEENMSAGADVRDKLQPTVHISASSTTGFEEPTTPIDGDSRHYRQSLILRHIYNRAKCSGWFAIQDQYRDTKVALRVQQEDSQDMVQYYQTIPRKPRNILRNDGTDLTQIATFLQCDVILAITSKATKMLLKHLSPEVQVIPLDNCTNIQVVENLGDFMSLREARQAAFIREFNMLLIWSSETSDILTIGRKLEEQIVSLIWNEKYNSEQGILEESAHSLNEKDALLEAGNDEVERTVALITPISASLAVLAISAFIGQDLHEIILQIKAETNYIACGIVVYFPLMMWLAAFFAHTFSTIVLQLFGPVSHLKSNTKSYSGMAPRRKYDFVLPQ